MRPPGLLGAAMCLLLLYAACTGKAAGPTDTPLPRTPTPRLTPTPIATATPTPAITPTAAPTVVPSPTVALPGADYDRILVLIEGARFIAEVADTPETRIQGLSDRESMPLDHAMWFDFGTEQLPRFWMYRMHFPLDMVWVNAALRVVHVTHNAPPPEPGVSERDLPRYDSNGIPVRYVLEINAGLAERYGIGPGDLVTLQPLPPGG